MIDLLADGRTHYTLLLSQVDRIERPKDRIWDGVVGGYGLGFMFGAVLVLNSSCPSTQPGSGSW
jgi:hypothetical protein